MDSASSRRLVFAFVLLAGLGAVRAPAAAPAGLLTGARVASKALLPPHAKAGSGVVGMLDGLALEAASIGITLPDGRVVTAVQSHVSRDDRLGTRTWTGFVDGSRQDRVVLSRRNGATAGFLEYEGRVYELRPAASGLSLLFEVREQPLDRNDVMVVPRDLGRARSKVDDSVVGGLSAASSPAFLDLLVVYTEAALRRHGQPALESLIAAAVASANASYRDSRVNITLGLVGMEPVALVEGASMPDTLVAAKTDPGIRAIRDRLAADVVIVVSEDAGWCGYAYIMSDNSAAFADLAYGVVNAACLGDRTLAHELGHIQGLAHDRETGGSAGALPYGRGYRRCAQDGNAFYDVMAYGCAGASRQSALTTFSSPGIHHDGYPTGIAFEIDPPNAADAVRSLNETAGTVAAFRAASVTPPARPTSLVATVVSATQTDLSWSDGASNETGFRVERSADGVDFVEIAIVGAGVTSHPDVTAGATRYSYRVAAFNGAGLSAYSNVAFAEARPAPARPPLSFAVTRDRRRAAQVSFTTDPASPEASYEVLRETWRRKSWRDASIRFSSPATGTHTFLDASGTGTFRYSIRACSASGCTDFSVPVTVRVTK